MPIKCTGECCYGFTLTRTPNGKESYLIIDPEELVDDGRDDLRPLIYQLHVVVEDKGEVYGEFGCTAWDSQTKLCTIYTTRPEICRRFPATSPCLRCGAVSAEDAVKKII